jgi:hypothetical protein
LIVSPQHLDVSTFSETQLLLVDYSPINDSSFIIGILEAEWDSRRLPIMRPGTLHGINRHQTFIRQSYKSCTHCCVWEPHFKAFISISNNQDLFSGLYRRQHREKKGNWGTQMVQTCPSNLLEYIRACVIVNFGCCYRGGGGYVHFMSLLNVGLLLILINIEKSSDDNGVSCSWYVLTKAITRLP